MQPVVGLADAVEIGFLLCPVGGADTVGAFEHDVFKIVGHTGCVGVFVLAACVDYYAAVDFGLAVLFAEDDFEAVVEVESLDGQTVLCRDREHGKKCYAEKGCFFHDVCRLLSGLLFSTDEAPSCSCCANRQHMAATGAEPMAEAQSQRRGSRARGASR